MVADALKIDFHVWNVKTILLFLPAGKPRRSMGHSIAVGGMGEKVVPIPSLQLVNGAFWIERMSSQSH